MSKYRQLSEYSFYDSGFNFTPFRCCKNMQNSILASISQGKTGYTSSVSPQRFLFPLNFTQRSAFLHFMNKPGGGSCVGGCVGGGGGGAWEGGRERQRDWNLYVNLCLLC